jgi:drug/metabolite transporter (DMT)-like permease
VAIALSLIAAVLYGAADFIGGLASRKTATVIVVIFSQLAGFAVLLCIVPFIDSHPLAIDLWRGVVGGLLGAVGIVLLYRALAIGRMGIVSPVTAVIAATIPVLFGLTIGERPSTLAWCGIGLAIFAVVLVSAHDPPEERTIRAALGMPIGVPTAILSGVTLGFFFIVLAKVQPISGLYPILSARIASVLALTLVALARRIPIRARRAVLPAIFFSGTLDMAANALYVLAAHKGLIAIVAVLTSLYPASTVALAAVVLHERLAPSQWVGVVLALIGVVLVAR